MSYSLSHNASNWLASMWSTRPQACRLAIMALLTASLMALALSFTTEAEFAAIAEGDLSACWQFWAILLFGAVLSGFGAGVVETTRFEDLAVTIPESALAAHIQNQLSHYFNALFVLMANASSAVLLSVIRDTQRYNRFISLRLPLLTPDLWPSGASPRVTYEPA